MNELAQSNTKLAAFAEQQLQLAALRQAVQGREIQIASAAARSTAPGGVESEPVPYGEAPRCPVRGSSACAT